MVKFVLGVFLSVIGVVFINSALNLKRTQDIREIIKHT